MPTPCPSPAPEITSVEAREEAALDKQAAHSKRATSNEASRRFRVSIRALENTIDQQTTRSGRWDCMGYGSGSWGEWVSVAGCVAWDRLEIDRIRTSK